MGWFGNGQNARIAALESELATLKTRVVKAEATASEAAERAYRYMKKAESRARRELDAPTNQDQRAGAAPVAETTAERLSMRRMFAWGARGRRQLRGKLSDPALELEATGTNGDGED